MGRTTLRVKKQDPVVDLDEFPGCELQFIISEFTGVGSFYCYGDCGRIEIKGGEAELRAMEGTGTTIAPCGQGIMITLDT